MHGHFVDSYINFNAVQKVDEVDEYEVLFQTLEFKDESIQELQKQITSD